MVALGSSHNSMWVERNWRVGASADINQKRTEDQNININCERWIQSTYMWGLLGRRRNHCYEKFINVEAQTRNLNLVALLTFWCVSRLMWMESGSNLYLQSHNFEPLFEKFSPNINAQETLRKSITTTVGLSDKQAKILPIGKERVRWFHLPATQEETCDLGTMIKFLGTISHVKPRIKYNT